MLALALLVILAFGMRVVRLDAVGVSEDEARKIAAVEAYRRGDFTPNAEHPMLMKSLILFSFLAVEQWNRTIAARHPSWRISEETALRLPNVLVGALTTVVLFLFARELFDPLVGWLTAILWATGLNAIAINRVAKEDTLLVFFMWLAFFFFMRAKHEGPVETARRQWLYRLSGASFGLMLASKYFPHYMGLIFLYNYLRPHDRETNAPLGRRAMMGFFLAFFIAFVVANPMLFHPETLRYLAVYLTETTVPHHGYEMMGELYYNNAWKLANRTPLYFYMLFLAVKVPPALLLAFAVGLIWIIRRAWPSKRARTIAEAACGHRAQAGWIALGALLVSGLGVGMLLHFIPVVYRVAAFTLISFLLALVFVLWGRKEEGPFFLRFMLVFWLVPYTLFGAKWLRYTLSLMPFVYMTAAVGIALVIREGLRRIRMDSARRGFVVAALAFFLGTPMWAVIEASPYYSFYVNRLGGGEAKRAYYFPHDEVYDAGMREAIAKIAARAPWGSRLGHDAPGVVWFYTRQFGRADLVGVELSSPAFTLTSDSRPLYVIVQKGRRYFENQQWLDELARRHRPILEVRVAGVVTTRVYEIRAHGP
ncbi:MAG: glycosyltransferase family 39 protein [Blastocatellia bacterium]|nr:glycosyltransferase family 39 protein [Blastocatellia bacterium]MDW8167994.1 glycosyltransferase family 39 protein [Acidobacteriota bacterium]